MYSPIRKLNALIATFFIFSCFLLSAQNVRYQNSLRGGLGIASQSLMITDGVVLNNAGGTTVSGASDLVLPPGSTIVKAVLVVEGYLQANTTPITSVRFKVPGQPYTTLTPASPGFIANPIATTPQYVQFIADVTSLMPANGYVTSVTPGGGTVATGQGTYAVADLTPFNTVNYGYGWALFVVYSNPNSKLRNITLADNVSTFGLLANVTIDVPNVKVPAVAPVTAIVAVTACWGERGATLSDGVSFGRNTGALTALADPTTGSTTDAMNSSIGFAVPNNVTVDGATGMANGNFVGRTPNNTFTATGTYGAHLYDCDIFNATGILPGSATPVTARFRQSGSATEAIGGGAYAISIDIVPAVLEKALSPTTIACGGTATYTFTIRNNEPGATNLTGLTFTDAIPSGLQIAAPNGVVVTNGGAAVVNAVPGSNTFSVTGLNLNAGQTCTITLNVTNKAGQFNPTCSGQAAFTNGPSNITGNPSTLANGVNPVCLVVSPPATPNFAPIGPICEGTTPLITLPTTSNEGITGTWNVATVANSPAGTTTYTFTPSAGQCANTTSLSVTITPKPASTFAPLTICAGTATNFPAASAEGHTGTWNVASVDVNNNGTYTFTPTSPACANTGTWTLTVTPAPAATLPAIPAFCAGATAPVLPSPLPDGTTGSWTPSVVNTTTAQPYVFTPNPGQCKSSASVTSVISPDVPVTPPAIPAFCAGAAAPVLPSPLPDGTTGSWTPSVVNTTAAQPYVFTPNPGQCKSSASVTSVISPDVPVTPPAIPAFCAGATAPVLPSPLPDGTTGSWTPSVVNTTTAQPYVFTPNPGQCKSSASVTSVINPDAPATLPAIPAFCAGATAPVLPSPLPDGTTGSWTPSVVNTTTAQPYVFTPNPGQCKSSASVSSIINPDTPVSLTTPADICEGEQAPDLTTLVNDGTTGTWTPPTANNTSTTVYTFNPNPGQCKSSSSITVTVNPSETPTFTAIGPFCAEDPAIPTTLQSPSNEGITGNWTPSTVNKTSTTTYTFNPDPGQCAVSTTFIVEIDPKPTPSFAAIPPLCAGDPTPTLQTPSNENIAGSWNPATVDNANTATYTFTPSPGVCATTATIIITVGPPQPAVFTQIPSFCEGTMPVPVLKTTSDNGVSGTWTPPVVDDKNSGTYAFKPNTGICAESTTMTITVLPKMNPTFTPVGPFCENDAITPLPTGSNDSPSITGSWSPGINNKTTTTYTFNPDNGQCANTATMTIDIDPPTTPIFNAPSAICAGETAPVLPTTDAGGITGSWDPATVDNTVTKTYTFNPDPGQCATTTSLTVTVNSGLTLSTQDVTTCANVDIQLNVTGAPAGSTYSWTPAATLTGANTQTPIAKTATNQTYTVNVTSPAGCTGTATVNLTIASGLSVTVSPATSNTCAGDNVTLTASPGGATTYTWTNNQDASTQTGATISVNPTVTTTYTVDVNNNGCVGQGTATINVGAPQAALFTQIPPFCSGSAAPTLSPTDNNGVSGTWNPAIVNTTTSGTYSFTPAAGECATSTTMSITVNPTPTLGTVTATCDGTNTNFVVVANITGGTAPFTTSAASPGSFGGTFAGNTFTSTPTPSGTTYSISVRDANSCGPVLIEGTRNCNCATAVGTMATNTLTLCQGATATATYTTGSEFLDANDAKEFVLHTASGGTLGTIITRSTTPTFSFGAGMTFGTTYYISAIVGDDQGGGTVNTSDPCLAVATGQPVIWNEIPTATATNTGAYCVGEMLQLNVTATPVSPSSTYTWTGPNTFNTQNPTKNNVQTSDAGTYSVTVTTNGCTSAPATTVVAVSPPPVAVPSSNSPICAGDNLTINAQPITGATYIWSGAISTTTTNPTLNFTNAQASNAGVYTLTVQVGNCISTPVNTTVTVNPVPTPSVTPNNVTICQGASTTLTAIGGGTGATYSWTDNGGGNPQSGSAISVTPSSTTVYTVICTGIGGCSANAQATVTVDPRPSITPVTDLAACAGSPVNIPAFTITPAGGTTTISWTAPNASNIGLNQVNGSGNVPTFNGSSSLGATALFTVSATRNGCPAVDESFQVTVNPNPVVSIATTPVCEGTTLQLFASPNGQAGYSWTTPNGPSGSTSNPLVINNATLADAGNYSVVVTASVTGCTGTGNVAAVINSRANPILSPNGTAYCANENTPVSLSSNFAGTWSGVGVNGSSFVPSNATVLTHTLTFTPNAGLCVNSGSVDLTVKPLPLVQLNVNPISGCAPLSVLLETNSGNSATDWNFGDGQTENTVSNQTTHIYTTPGTFDVTVTNTLNGCTATDTFNDVITVQPDPIADFDVSNSVVFTSAPEVDFENKTIGGNSYTWTFGDGTTSGATNPTHTYPESAATYTIKLLARSAAGCLDSISKTIQVKEELIYYIPNTFTPDGDQYNNVFQPVFTSGFDPQNFKMTIFNRWGEVIFETLNAEIGWDGTYQGKLVQEGIYTWKISVKDKNSDNKYEFQGHVFMVK